MFGPSFMQPEIPRWLMIVWWLLVMAVIGALLWVWLEYYRSLPEQLSRFFQLWTGEPG